MLYNDFKPLDQVHKQLEITIEQKDSLQDIANLRDRYLDELYEAQELFLEMQVREARVFLIRSEDAPIGYFLLDDENTLLEYYVVRDEIARNESIFAEILQHYSVPKALCKSFDFSLLSCCVAAQKRVRPIGVLFREFDPPHPFTERTELTVRPAIQADEQLIIDVNEEIFEDEQEIRETIANQSLLIFEKAHKFVGFGIFQPTIAGRPEHDIGMLVHRDYRNQGYGSYIIRYLNDHCRQLGGRGVCGCDIRNTASRRALEKAGYIARHRLLECAF